MKLFMKNQKSRASADARLSESMSYGMKGGVRRRTYFCRKQGLRVALVIVTANVLKARLLSG